MSVKKDKTTGKWECRYYVRKTDGTLTSTRKRGFNTKDEAMKYEMAHKHDSAVSESDTFSMMFDLLAKANRASESTTQQRRQRLKKYAGDLWDRKMKSITKNELINWRDELDDTDLATATKNDIIGYVKQIGRFAWEVYDIPDNCKVLKNFPKEIEDFKEMVIINADQFKLIRDAEHDELLKDFFQFLFMTGCRKGEARALLKTDYNPTRKAVHICKAMRRDESSTRTTKTRTSRWVPLDDSTNRIVAALAQRKGPYLFGDYSPVSNNTIRMHFLADLEDSGLPHMRIHDLRHSHVSLLWDAGVPIPEISKRIGHSSPKVTMECYAHIFDKDQTKSLNVLNGLL